MKSSSKIYASLVECIGDEAIVKSALTPGTYPRVFIENLRREGRMEIPNGIYQGDCHVEKINHVYLDVVLCRGVENDPWFTDILEQTLLHETVHWGRFIGRKSGLIDGEKEAGSWFEHLAYGFPYRFHHDIKCRDSE